jgi:hypothetical protein
VLWPLLARFMLVSPRLYGALEGRTQVPKGLYGRAMAGSEAGPGARGSRSVLGVYCLVLVPPSPLLLCKILSRKDLFFDYVLDL